MTTLSKPKIAIGQAGGPTAVINASLTGFIQEAIKDFQIYAIINSFQGLVQDWLVEIDEHDANKLLSFRDVPAAVLGSGRWQMTDSDFEKAVLHLKRRGITSVVFIGGNGTMEACLKLEQAAQKMKVELSVIGIPKTVDNDLMQTDHAPGYGSAARYVAATVRDIGEDLRSMSNFEKVRIIETMGRNVGWLTAASLLLKENEDQPPHLVYVPERPFCLQTFLNEVSSTVDRVGHALIVVGEGLRDETGTVLAQIPLTSDGKRQVLGGVSTYLAQQVSDHLHLPVRSELLGMSQRCSRFAVSKVDRKEAEMLGREAVKLIRKEKSGIMLTLQKKKNQGNSTVYDVGYCNLAEVAGKERTLPEMALNEEGNMLSDSFRHWLRFLVGDDLMNYPQWEKPQLLLQSR